MTAAVRFPRIWGGGSRHHPDEDRLRWLLALLAALGSLFPAIPTAAQHAPSLKLPCRILFLGEQDSARTQDFESFLAERFSSVRVADRWTWDRSLLSDADVVLLDWPQDDGVSKWMLAGDRTVEPRCPLGLRQAWATPTLLLGSAGLNLAWAWDVKGGFG